MSKTANRNDDISEHSSVTPEMQRRRDDGIALIVVMSVLAMLIVIATPFMLQAKKDHASAATVSERHRARQVANSALEWAKISLLQTHQGLEHQGQGLATPYWDAPSEFQVDAHPKSITDLIGLQGGRFMGNPRGDLWSIRVRDEGSFVNANSATPFFWSALVGRALVTAEAKPNAGALEVESTAGFPKEKGELVVGGRVVPYRRATETTFTGLSLRYGVPEGAIVMSKMAWDLALYGQKSARAGQGMTSLASVTELKNVALYGSGALKERQLSQILEPVTHISYRESAEGWLTSQRITAELDPQSFEPEKNGQPVRVSNPDFFNPGTIVKISDGQSTEYNIVRYARRTGNGGIISLLDQVSRVYPYETATISAQMRHPVNINNCSKSVLVLLLDGLDYAPRWRRHSKPEDRISTALAANIADVLIKNRPIRGTEHLVDLVRALFHTKAGTFSVGESGITQDMVSIPGTDDVPMIGNHALAVVQNSLNPNHRGLINSTMPFSYVSNDYYTVETASSVNNGAGSELARFRMRETFRSAPARELRYSLKTQADFEKSIVTGRAGRRIETHPNLMSFFTAETAKPEMRMFRYLHNFDDPQKVGFRPSRVEGDVRLQPSRMYGGYTEHFDGNITGPAAAGLKTKRTTVRTEDIIPEGLPLTSGAYNLDLNVQGQTQGQGQKANSVADGNGLNPFVVEFYMKPNNFSSGQALFSAIGQDRGSDFIRAWYDPSQRAFRFQVHDIALDDPRSQTPSVAEVRWVPTQGQIEDDTWYHFSLHTTGTKPGEISLHVDGFKRGETKYQSALVSGLAEDGDSFEVQDATDWPDQGAFLVGTEVVNATRQGNSFTIFQNPLGGFLPLGRGARGTTALSHNSGETVKLFGYSTPLRRLDNTAGEVLAEGGASLRSDFAPFSVLAIGEQGTQTDSITLPGPPPLSLGVEFLDLAATNSIELAELPTQNLNQAANTFQSSGGYALIVGFVLPPMNPTTNVLDDALQQAVIMVRYSGRSGNQLTGVTRAQDNFNPKLVDNQFLNPAGAMNAQDPKFFWSTLPKVITRFTGGGSNAPRLAQIFPISVGLTSNNGYKGPEFNASQDPVAEYLQLGTPQLAPTLGNFASHAIEWVSYFGVDRANNDFLANDKNSIQRAVAILLATRTTQIPFNPNNPNDFQLPDIENIGNQLNWRRRASTAQFGWDDINNAAHTHTGGSAVIPTFRVSWVGGRSPGYGDAVSLITAGNSARELQFISWGFEHAAFDARVCFTSNVRGQLNQIALPNVSTTNLANGNGVWDRRLYTRVVKFPSGELPLITSRGQADIGGDLVGGVPSSGILDEVRVRAVQRNRYVLWDDQQADYTNSSVPSPYPIGLSANATQVPIVSALWVPQVANQLAGGAGVLIPNFWLPGGRQLDLTDQIVELSNDAGLVMIDDEIIAFRSVTQGGAGGAILTDCIRGFMNTDVVEHSFGASVLYLDFRATSKLLQSTTRESFDFQVADAQDFGLTDNNGRAGGTFLAGNEMVHFTTVGGNGLQMPRQIDRKTGEEKGIFRARYGTRSQAHSADDIVVQMPFRYWDRYAPNSNDPELSFYEFAVNEPRSFLKRLTWNHRAEKPRLGMKVLLRFDPKVPWDADPESSNGALLLLDSKRGQGQNVLSQHILNRSAQGLEARVFFTYDANAFDPINMNVNDWKETPHLLDVELRYLAAPYVISRETLK